MDEKPSLGFVGAGKVGSVLARLWYGAGYSIQAIHSRTPARAYQLALSVQSKLADSPEQVIDSSTITLLTVPDDAIATVVETIGSQDVTEKAIIHTSGVYGIEVLKSLAERGAMIGSIHPIFPFSTIDTGIQALTRGVAFAIEANDKTLRKWLYGMVESLRGSIFEVQPGKKALYHSALVFASNYVVTLYALSEQLLVEAGAARQDVQRALNVLVGQTLENIRSEGLPGALTGPLVRGDIGTLNRHLSVLDETNPQIAGLYVQLARATFPMLTERDVDLKAIRQVLDRSAIHANNGS